MIRASILIIPFYYMWLKSENLMPLPIYAPTMWPYQAIPVAIPVW